MTSTCRTFLALSDFFFLVGIPSIGDVIGRIISLGFLPNKKKINKRLIISWNYIVIGAEIGSLWKMEKEDFTITIKGFQL